MILELRQIDYEGNPTPSGKWWSWIEICDDCGVTIRSHNAMSMGKPNEDEESLCINCLRKRLNMRKENKYGKT